MYETPDLSKEFHPVPKVYKVRKEPKRIGAGVKSKNWDKGREVLKKKFEAWGITSCEIKLEGCLKDNFLSFAHTQRRHNFNLDEVRDYRNVVLACQQCHNTVDNEMITKESYALLTGIVADREKTL